MADDASGAVHSSSESLNTLAMPGAMSEIEEPCAVVVAAS